jgi:HSP20 family protein
MAKKQKEEVAVKKKGSTESPGRTVSPLRAWERELDRMFQDFPMGRWPRLRELEGFRLPRELRITAPSLDMYEESDEVVVKAEIPGMSKDDIEITLSDSHLTLRGEKKKEEETKEKDYYRCEREYGSFYRSVELPAAVKSDGVKATLKNGVLEVHLPKSAQSQKKEIHVDVE